MTTPASPSGGTSPGTSSGVIVHVYGRTDIGRMREHNEDAFVVADLTTMNATLEPALCTHVSGERGTLFMVADGMGGAAAGEIASAMAVDVVLDEIRKRWTSVEARDPMTFAASLRLATEAANLRIHQFATDHPEHRGMGTTATVAGLLGDTLYLTQVGDSRAYLIRAGEARQITKDQSLMQRLIEAGEITVEEAEQSDRRNIILQALGPEARISIDLTHQRIRRDDTLILCSDGLSGQVKTDEIARIATEEKDLMTICRRLIDRANETGGPDNITVIAARFEGESLIPAEAGEEVGHRVYPLGDETTPSVPAQKFVRRRSGTPPVVSGVDGASPDGPPSLVDDGLVAARRERGRPLVIALALLALIAGAVAVWYIADLVASRRAVSPPSADSTAAEASRPGGIRDSLSPPL